ncbi:MAG: hypothetical protein RLY97_1260 [Pseudomonadota bacterium]
MGQAEDHRFLNAAAQYGLRGRPQSRPNPAVGAVIVANGVVVGRGFTQAGGRPHAEAVALAQAGPQAQGGTLYVTLEPCAHTSPRGVSCAESIATSGLARVVIGCMDPDPRTAGAGLARIRDAGIAAEFLSCAAARASLIGYLTMRQLGRPYVTLKMAVSLDGCIAMADGTSRWITGDVARAHTHMVRAMSEAILVGGGTMRTDNPRLDVRLAGLEGQSPTPYVLSRSPTPAGWHSITAPNDIHAMRDVQYLLVEGGAQTAAAFLAANLVDRLLIYRAPIIIGGGLPSIADLGLKNLADAHGIWQHTDHRPLGPDTLDIFERVPCSPE